MKNLVIVILLFFVVDTKMLSRWCGLIPNAPPIVKEVVKKRVPPRTDARESEKNS